MFEEQFRTVLEKGGASKTPERLHLFRMLRDHNGPYDVAGLIDSAKPIMNRTTVYRNLDLFEKLSITHRVYSGWKYKVELSDMFRGHHHHMSCLGCGRTIDIEDEAHIDEFIHEVAEKADFTPRRHVFEIDGYCKDCAQTKSN